MANGIPHPDETRAAVLAALLAGQSINAVAAQFKVGRATVAAWRDAAGLKAGHVGPQSREAIGALVIDYLAEALTTLKSQQTFFRDSAWLGKQDAADLAVLHGVTADKAFRIISALDDDPEGESAEDAAAPHGGGVDPTE